MHIICNNGKWTSNVIHSSPKVGKWSEVNRRAVLAFHMIGKGHAASERFSAFMNMQQPIHKTRWTQHIGNISSVASECAEEMMKASVLTPMRAKMPTLTDDQIGKQATLIML